MIRLLTAACRHLALFVIVSTCCLLSSSHLLAADADLAKSTPSGAIFFAEISGLEPWIEKLQNSPLVASLPSNPQVQAFYATPPGRKADAGRKMIENQLGMDLWTLAKTAFGGNVSVALYPHEGRKEPDAVIAVQVKDVASLNKNSRASHSAADADRRANQPIGRAGQRDDPQHRRAGVRGRA